MHCEVSFILSRFKNRPNSTIKGEEQWIITSSLNRCYTMVFNPSKSGLLWDRLSNLIGGGSGGGKVCGIPFLSRQFGSAKDFI